jgi:NDP-sugar pyrophosphorylase family protein
MIVENKLIKVCLKSIVVLAGGEGRRLYPLTKTIPKAMLEVAGKPFISHQLTLFKKNRIEKVTICAGYLGRQIKDFVKDGSAFGLKADFSFDGKKLRGTGGAIKKALPLLEDVFFVIYGDSYLPVDFKPISDYFFSHRKKGLMVVLKNNNSWDKSNVMYNDGDILAYDKKKVTKDMKHIDYGLSIFRRDVFTDTAYGDIFDLAGVYKDLIRKGELLGYEIKRRFYEVGSLEGFRETERFILGQL